MLWVPEISSSIIVSPERLFLFFLSNLHKMLWYGSSQTSKRWGLESKASE